MGVGRTFVQNAVGFRNAIAVKVQPDDAEWEAGDLRYNVLRWTSSPDPPFGGYGPSFVNPRTGQILGSDIMLEWVFVTHRVRLRDLLGNTATDRAAGHGAACALGHCLHQSTLFGAHTLRATGAPAIERVHAEDGVVVYALSEGGAPYRGKIPAN